MNVKKKGGIFKGLKYFSQIFDEDEQKEIQIGLPTDVKHVAHIGWDGPSANPPSWMDEFRSQNGGYQSAPLDGCVNNREDELSEDKNGDAANSSANAPAAQKTSRRHLSMDNIDLTESLVGSPSSHRVVKNKDKDSSKNPGTKRRKDKSSKKKEATGPIAPNKETSSQSVPAIPKKTRRKKSKDLDGTVRASSKSTSKRVTRNGPVPGSEDGAIKSNSASSGLAALEDE